MRTFTIQIPMGLKEGYDGKTHTIEEVMEVCKAFCDKEHLCVSIAPTNFVYVDGQEPGCVIQFINYPRFPSPEDILLIKAKTLALLLKDKFRQKGISVITPTETMTNYDDNWI